MGPLTFRYAQSSNNCDHTSISEVYQDGAWRCGRCGEPVFGMDLKSEQPRPAVEFEMRKGWWCMRNGGAAQGVAYINGPLPANSDLWEGLMYVDGGRSTTEARWAGKTGKGPCVDGSADLFKFLGQ